MYTLYKAHVHQAYLMLFGNNGICVGMKLTTFFTQLMMLEGNKWKNRILTKK
jgi:hypothetical protein